MSDDPLHTKRRSIGRRNRWLILTVLLLLLLNGARLLLQSDSLLDKLRERAVTEVNNRIDGRFSVAEIKGDLLFGLRLSGLELRDREGTLLLEVHSIELRYTLPQLLKGLEIDLLRIDGMRAFIEQTPDGRWNFESLSPADERRTEPVAGAEPLFWQLRQFNLRGSSISIHSDQLPDSSLALTRLELTGSAGYGAHGWNLSMGDLRFLLEEGRLPRAVEVGARGSLQGDEITLERLLVGTGRSFLSADGEARLMDQLSAVIGLEPLSYLDLAAYADLPVRQNLKGNIVLEGDLKSMHAVVNLSAPGLETLQLEGGLHVSDGISLSDLRIHLSSFDGPLFTGLADTPRIDSVSLQSEGVVPLAAPSEIKLNGELLLDGVVFGEGPEDRAEAVFDWADDRLDLRLVLTRLGQQLEADLLLHSPFAERAAWQAELRGEELDLAVLLADSTLESQLHFIVEAEGFGYSLSDEPIHVRAALFDSRMKGQAIDQLLLEGELTADLWQGSLEAGREESRIRSEIYIRQWQQSPEYLISTELEQFDLAVVTGLEEFPTQLNATLQIEGIHFDPERLRLVSSIQFDSSLVNGEPIDMLQAELAVADRVVTVRNATLRSPIADATFYLHYDLKDLQNPDNRLELDGEIKDIHPLAPLFRVDTLQAGGRFGGRIYRLEEGELRFDGELQLSELLYDSLSVSGIQGSIAARLTDDPSFSFDLQIDTTAVGAFSLESIRVRLNTLIEDSLYSGDLMLDIVHGEEYAVHHRADYRYFPDDLTLHTTAVDIRSPEQTLELERPFDLSLRQGVLRFDPMQIVSKEDGAYMMLAVPWMDDERQEVQLELERLDLGTIQRSLFGELYADARLSGQFNLLREDGELRSDANLIFEELRYRTGRIDSLRIVLSVADGRLDLGTEAWNNGSGLLEIRADLPFEPGDPLTFDDRFFEQPVDVQIDLSESELALWSGFLPRGDEMDIEGLVSSHSTITGTAGDPLLSGRMEISDARLSGVPVDLFELAFGYDHERSQIDLEGSLRSINRPIAQFRANLPFYLDMRSFRIDLPDESDEVYVRLQTEQFDLAIFNDFIDRDLVRDLRGEVTGNIDLEGPIATLRSSGELRLRNGQFRFVPAAITLEEITSDLQMSPGLFELTSFTMRSGPGRVTAQGSIELDGHQPGQMDFNMEAVQFRVANTPEMNAIVDLSSRLQGTVEEPRLTGTLHVRSGFVQLQNFGEQAIETVQLEEEPEPVPFAFFESMEMEMSVSVNRQFFIRNRQFLDMEVELDGVVDLVKAADGELQLFGSMEGVRGYARPLGRQFELEEALVTFYGPPENPELLIRTRFRPPRTGEEITIWYIIEGSVEEPDFRFESDPYLELQDMISYTLFGQPFYALDSWQQALSGGGGEASASDMALELVVDRVGTLAAQQLGIDVVQVETNRSGSRSSTTIKTGWYLSERTFFAILNEISGTSPKTLFMLEYLLRENLELIITQGDDSREGIDLRWKYDY